MRITITWEEESKAAKEPTYYHGARVCVEGVLNRRSIFYSFQSAFVRHDDGRGVHAMRYYEYHKSFHRRPGVIAWV